MKNKPFSSKLYRDGLRQLLIPGIVLIILSTAFAVLPTLLSLSRTKSMEKQILIEHSNYTIPYTSVADVTNLLAVIMVLAPVILCMILFSYLNRRNGSDIYHSLPKNRACLFISFSGAVYTWIIAILLIPLAVVVLMFLIAGEPVNGASIPPTALTYLAGALLITAEILIAMSITGTNLTNLVVFGLILFLPRFLTTVFEYAICNNVPIVTYHDFGIFGANMNIPVKFILNAIPQTITQTNNIVRDDFSSQALYTFAPAIVYTLILALVYLVLGCLLFQNRKSETAGRGAPNRIWQHIFRCAITLPITIWFPLIYFAEPHQFWRTYIGPSIIIGIIALFIYFLYELITTKKLQNLISAAPVFLLIIFADIVFGVALSAGKSSALNFQPEPDHITSVSLGSSIRSLQSNNNPNDFNVNNISQYNQYLLNDTRLDNPDLIQMTSNLLKETATNVKQGAGNTYSSMLFQIHLKSGHTVERMINLDDNERNLLKQNLLNNTQFIKALDVLPPSDQLYNISITGLSKESSKKIWDQYITEYNTLSNQSKLNLFLYSNTTSYDQSSSTASPVGNTLAAISAFGFYHNDSYQNFYSLTPLTPKALQLYIDAENRVTASAFRKFAAKKSMRGNDSLAVNLFNAGADSDVKNALSNYNNSSTDNMISLYTVAAQFTDSNSTGNQTDSINDYTSKILAVLKQNMGKPVDVKKPVICVNFRDFELIGNGTDSYFLPASADEINRIYQIISSNP